MRDLAEAMSSGNELSEHSEMLDGSALPEEITSSSHKCPFSGLLVLMNEMHSS
jgi:hypothetical protein